MLVIFKCVILLTHTSIYVYIDLQLGKVILFILEKLKVVSVVDIFGSV